MYRFGLKKDVPAALLLAAILSSSGLTFAQVPGNAIANTASRTSWDTTVLVGNWHGEWANDLGMRGADSLTIQRDASGKLTGVWGGDIKISLKPLSDRTFELSGKTATRGYQGTGTFQDGVLSVDYVSTYLNASGSARGHSSFTQRYLAQIIAAPATSVATATATLVPIGDSTLIGAKSQDAINAFETALDALQRRDGNSAALAAVKVLNHIGIEGAKTPFGAFTVILAYFGYRQAGKNVAATQMLEQAEQFCNKGAWPYSAFSYLSKKSQESAFLGVCKTDEQEAQARFCIAVNKSLSGVDAQSDFDWLNANLPATNKYAEFARNFNQK